MVLAEVALGPAHGASAGLVTSATAGVEAVALIRQRPGRVTTETLRPGEGFIWVSSMVTAEITYPEAPARE